MSKLEKVRSAIKCYGLRVEPFGCGVRVVGKGVDVIACNLDAIDAQELNPAWAPLPRIQPRHRHST